MPFNTQKKIPDSKTKRAGKYLGQRKDEIKDRLTWGKHSHIPFLKNGCVLKTHVMIHVGDKKIKILFRSTCSFDSATQITLVGAQDHPEIQNKVIN